VLLCAVQVKVKGKGAGGGGGGGGALVRQLPTHLQQLLALVAVQGRTEVVDVTGGAGAGTKAAKDGKAAPGAKKKGSQDEAEDEEEEEAWDGHEAGAAAGPAVLPAGLAQCEYRVPAEDKDVLAYYYLVKVTICSCSGPFEPRRTAPI
jgi:hypothetical protein